MKMIQPGHQVSQHALGSRIASLHNECLNHLTVSLPPMVLVYIFPTMQPLRAKTRLNIPNQWIHWMWTRDENNVKACRRKLQEELAEHLLRPLMQVAKQRNLRLIDARLRTCSSVLLFLALMLTDPWLQLLRQRYITLFKPGPSLFLNTVLLMNLVFTTLQTLFGVSAWL